MQVERVAEGGSTLRVRRAAIFSNFVSLKKHLDGIPRGQHVILNFSQAKVVDHSMLSQVHDYATDYQNDGGTFELAGLDAHTALSASPLATRYLLRSKKTDLQRPTEARP